MESRAVGLGQRIALAIKCCVPACAALATVAACCVAGAADSYPTAALLAESQRAQETLLAHYAEIDARSHLGSSLQERLDGDAAGAQLVNKPDWMSAADYADHNVVLFKLNASLISQLASGAYHPIGAVRGADDTVFRSPVDGTMQPLAVYVPARYDSAKPTP